MFIFNSLICTSADAAGAAFSVLNGKRLSIFKIIGGQKQALGGSEAKLSLKWIPFVRVPVDLGISASQMQWQDEYPIKGSEYDLETELWDRDNKMYIPYLKFAYTLGGSYVFNGPPVIGGEPRYHYKVSGYRMAVGLRWQFTSHFGVLLEGDKNVKTLKFKSIKDAGQSTISEPSNMVLESFSFLAGFVFKT